MNETVTEELARNVKKTTTPSTSDATSFNCRLCKKAFIHECFVIIKEKKSTVLCVSFNQNAIRIQNFIQKSSK